jgi:hypothetical protein
VRYGRPSKQRLWLGPDRYRSGRRDAGTNTKRFAHSSVKRYSLRSYDTNSNSNANGNPNSHNDGYCYAHRNGYGNSDSFGNADFDGQTDAYAEGYADAKNSPHPQAQAVEIFATAKISSQPLRRRTKHGSSVLFDRAHTVCTLFALKCEHGIGRLAEYSTCRFS